MDYMEYKSVDVSTSQAFDITIPLTLLNGIERGSDINQRTGRSILLKLLEVNGYVSAGTVESVVRIILFYDRQTSGVAPTSSMLLYPMRTYGLYPLGFSRFEVLYDGQYHVNESTEVDSKKIVLLSIPLNHVVVYNSGSSGLVDDIVTGALYIATVGNESTVDPSRRPTFVFSTRVYYTESS